MRNLRSYITFSSVSNLVLLLLLLTLLIIPNAKALIIEGLMKIGLFQPDVPELRAKPVASSATASAFRNVVFMDGKLNRVKLSDQKAKVVFINFWAAWCPPCIAEMPTIDQLYEKYKNNNDVMFLMVDVDGKVDASTSFMKDRGFKLPVHIPASELPEALFSGSMPTTVILDKSGNIAFRHVGGADYGNPKITDFIEKLLKAKN